MNSWICCYQGQNNNIYFLTDKSPERDFMKYYKFMEYINAEFQIKDFFVFKENIDKFKVVLLYSDNTWEVIPDEIQDASFEELYAINGENIEEKKSAFQQQVDNSKVRLNQIFDFRKKEIKGQYKK